jgi:hypothetical protein
MQHGQVICLENEIYKKYAAMRNMTTIVTVCFIQIREVCGLAVMPISYCNMQHG